MFVARVKLESLSPYSQGRHITTEKNDKESAKDFEVRCWRERCHYDQNGNIFIPAMAFKNCMSDAAKYLSIQIPGKGKATYTKHIEAGLLVLEPLTLPIKVDDVKSEWVFVPSNGQRGGGSRVDKCFPVIHQWAGEVEFHIFDETITQDVFTTHLREAGKFIGIGRWRPRNNGTYGRFAVKSVDWREE